jgi:hypothetical protein
MRYCAEDWEAMAEGIECLVMDPDLFSTMSRVAAEQVRGLSDGKRVIDSELALFRMYT